MKRVKTGRRASEDDRARARALVALYRLAEQSPDGEHCVNPNDEPELHAVVRFNNPEYLLFMLERFAESGTFADVDTSIEDRFMLQHEMKKLRASGLSYYDAIAQLEVRHGASRSTIERTLSGSPKK